jgi:hypothetical protein
MSELLGVLGQSPELLATLNDPRVRALMRDPNNLRMVAGLLRQFGEQAAAASAPEAPASAPS